MRPSTGTQSDRSAALLSEGNPRVLVDELGYLAYDQSQVRLRYILRVTR